MVHIVNLWFDLLSKIRKNGSNSKIISSKRLNLKFHIGTLKYFNLYHDFIYIVLILNFSRGFQIILFSHQVFDKI